MVNASEVKAAIDTFAPYAAACEWDNSGINVDCGAATGRILVALDVTEQTLAQAAARACGMIVSHHPLMFRAVKELHRGGFEFEAARRGLSVVSAHTNWDCAEGGVCDVLAQTIGLRDVTAADEFLRVGRLERPFTPEEFARMVREKLDAPGVALIAGSRPVVRVALAGGAADAAEGALASGADAYLTGEIKYHDAILIRSVGLTAIAAGHFETERPSVPLLAQKLSIALDGRAEVLIADESAPAQQYI